MPENLHTDGGELVCNTLRAKLKDCVNEAKTKDNAALMETLLLTTGAIARQDHFNSA